MRKQITRKRISAVWMKLQSITFNPALPAKSRSDVRDAMDILDEIRADMRRKEIFAAGANARKPEPRLDGQELGSSESMTFYDGYASTHPKFEKPYRT